MNDIELNNGVKIPQIGMGTWQINDREVLLDIMKAGYDMGYRLIDTAAAYSNEMAIGKVLSALSLPREELFISDKVWNTCRGYEKVQEACRKSMKKLKTDYLDLYLIHWPASMKLYTDWQEINADTWRGMEKLYQDGLVRAIGVCNFKVHHLEALQKNSTVSPMVNQVEYHPGMPQTEVMAYCREHKICMEASSPLGNGQVLMQPQLMALAENKVKTTAQICLRYAIERNMVVIPKTSNPERLRDNLAVFDFQLSEDELKNIDEIPYCGGIGIDPDEVTEFG